MNFLPRFSQKVKFLSQAPFPNLIKMQSDHLLSAIHIIHIGEKLLMTSLLSVKERFEGLDNVILLLIRIAVFLMLQSRMGTLTALIC